MAHTIYRTKRTGNFTTVTNEWIYNPALSAKAKGILLYLLSKPDDWTTRLEDIVSHMADGIDSIKSGLKELQKARHLLKRPRRDPRGKIIGWETLVFEYPMPEVENPHLDETPAESPEEGFTRSGKSTMWENHNVENPLLLNTELELNTELTKDKKEGAGAPADAAAEAESIKEAPEKPVKATGDRLPKAANVAFFNRIKEIYNAQRPPKWAEVQKCSDERLKYLNRLIKVSSSVAEAEAWISDALVFVSRDSWWSNIEGDFAKLFRDARFVEWAEKARAKKWVGSDELGISSAAPDLTPIANESDRAGHKYPQLVEAGLGGIWVGPGWNDFDPGVVKAAIAYLRGSNSPHADTDAKCFLSKQISYKAWGVLASLRDKAAAIAPTVAAPTPSVNLAGFPIASDFRRWGYDDPRHEALVYLVRSNGRSTDRLGPLYAEYRQWVLSNPVWHKYDEVPPHLLNQYQLSEAV